MRKQRKSRIFAADFETTVYDEQQYTEVWSAAIIELYTDEPMVYHSIEEFFNYLFSLNDNAIVYFHNLKFDGSFILPYLIKRKGFTQAFDSQGKAIKDNHMPCKSLNYVISDMGQWYTIKVCTPHTKKIIEFRDSLKLMPMPLKAIGKGYGTKHQKLDMEYTGFRFAGCEITPEELEYIKNDVYVLKEALEIMFEEGHNKLTIGSCCMTEYKHIIGRQEFSSNYPDCYEMPLDLVTYGEPTVGDYIHNSYRGGWCYVVKGKECEMKYNGLTADVNSLYPSMMHSESGNYYPIGEPHFWVGDIPPEALINHRYYFVKVRTRFYIKENYLPFIQIKKSPYYRPNEMLETSDVFYNNCYWKYLEDDEGNEVPTTVELTLTMTDWILMQEHYDLVDCEILSGCWFESRIGIFDEYIDKYKTIKIHAKGAKRTIAKLFLNNLYGKMASSPDSSHKLCNVDDDIVIHFTTVKEMDKQAGYIPIGSAITSYARNFTIRAAQKNYYGVNERGFIYADTDSIHCDLKPEELKSVPVDDNAFCCWKLESCWDKAWFVRQKTYIEHITHNDLKPVDRPYYDIKCAGMPDRCKQRVIDVFEGREVDRVEGEKIPERMEDFKVGIKVFGKLIPKRISGGLILKEDFYTMRLNVIMR